MIKNFVLSLLFVSSVLFGQAKKVVSSDIQWWGYKIAKTEASSHSGTVGLKNGVVILKKNAVAGGNFVLDMNSITATDLQGEYQQKLNGHLKNGDFFEVDKFPVATFKILAVKKLANGKSMVTGKLTAKGKTNAVTFPASIKINKGVVTFESDKFSIDRQKWGIAYQSSMKDVVIKDEIDLVVKFTAQ